ncbi:MAG: hypothetical protein KDD47_27005 [Acidobacteria bacterium]|nr:hypothetical protein [Acidobacteriota bacterium]
MPLRIPTLALYVTASLGLWLVPPIAGAASLPAFEPFHPASAEASVRPRAAADPLSAGHELSHEARCNPEKRRAALVTLSWQPSRSATPTVQRVEISKFHEGFEVGRFETTDPLPRNAATVAVDAPEPGVNYYWRVVTEEAAGWVTSPVERFEVPVCPWDGELLEPPGEAVGAAQAQEPATEPTGGEVGR